METAGKRRGVALAVRYFSSIATAMRRGYNLYIRIRRHRAADTAPFNLLQKALEPRRIANMAAKPAMSSR